MKTLVIIAQHHGAFLTIKSAMENSSHDRMIVLVPSSQVDKYNDMYNSHKDNPDFAVFKDYDKRMQKFCGKDVHVVEWDASNTVSSAIDILDALISTDINIVVNAGTLVLSDPFLAMPVTCTTNLLTIGKARVYGKNKKLNMYHMIGLPKEEVGFDANVFILNMNFANSIHYSDREVINYAITVNRLGDLPRAMNMRHDPLIGTAISARETVMHNVNSVNASIVNYWAPCIRKYEDLTAEETFGYPFDIYLEYAKKVKRHLPAPTFERIKRNGEATKYWIGTIRDIVLN